MNRDRQTRPAHSGLYRSRSGMIFGVAKGLAESAGFPIWFVRVAFIFVALLTSVIPTVLVYLLLAIFMRQEPVIEFNSDEDQAFYDTYGNSRKSALERMRGILEKLDKRVQRLENAVTDPERDWDRRFHNY
jgi:phage shock protein C